MDWFAEFCIWIKSLDVGQDVYMSFHYLSVAAAALLFLWLAKKMNVKWWRALIALLVDCAVFYSLMMIIGWAESGFEAFGKRNLVTVFIWGPAIFFIGSKISGMPWKKLCVMSAPALPLIHGVSRPGCMIVGCCRGFESSFGIYNVKTGNYLFPIQTVEMLLSLAMVAVLVYILKRKKYEYVRWLYPFMLFVYGIIQFVCDFYRDNEKLSWGVSQRGYHALSLIIVGAIWLYVLYEIRLKEEARKNRFKKPNQKEKY